MGDSTTLQLYNSTTLQLYNSTTPDLMLDRNGIAQRIAQELQDGWYVNLGIGIPTLIANYLLPSYEVCSTGGTPATQLRATSYL